LTNGFDKPAMLTPCRLLKCFEIVPGTEADYQKLSRFHYRDGRLGPFVAIFALRLSGRLGRRAGSTPVGVIVYSMPVPGCRLRSLALRSLLCDLPRRARLAVINRNIRTISRVIIEPRVRGLGLAGRLVRETMPLMEVPFVEALAVMGHVNPFFEKAGMQPYKAPTPPRVARLTEALSSVGIEEDALLEPTDVQRALERLDAGQSRFIESEIKRFLNSYGKRRLMSPGLERTRFILSRLNERPAYYLWQNPKRPFTGPVTAREKQGVLDRSG